MVYPLQIYYRKYEQEIRILTRNERVYIIRQHNFNLNRGMN